MYSRNVTCHPMSPDFKSMPTMSLRKETFKNG